VKQFSHATKNEDNTHDAEEYFTEHFADLIKLMTGEEPSPATDQLDGDQSADLKEGYIELRQDLTQLPMVVNIRNTNFNPYSYNAPECPLCCNKPCKSCALLLSPQQKDFTLR